MTTYDPIPSFTARVSNENDFNTLITACNGVSVPAYYIQDNIALHTTTSTSWVELDANVTTHNITTLGGDLLIGWSFQLENTGSFGIEFRLMIDGVEAHDDRYEYSSYTGNSSALVLLTGINAGTTEVKVEWRVEGGTGELEAGSIFFIREV